MRKSGQEAAEGAPAGEVAGTTRRRRRTRGGREVGTGQTGTDQIGTGLAGTGQAGTDQGETRRKAS